MYERWLQSCTVNINFRPNIFKQNNGRNILGLFQPASASNDQVSNSNLTFTELIEEKNKRATKATVTSTQAKPTADKDEENTSVVNTKKNYLWLIFLYYHD